MAKRHARRLILGAVLAVVSSACSVSETKVPALAGPSELALSFALTATPDSISQDGASQSSIVVTARDVNGKSISGIVFRMDTFAGGQAVDYGRLSGKTLVTGSDGRALAVYTSPPPPPSGSTLAACAPLATGIPLPGGCVTIAATPVSTGFSNGTVSQIVVIHLVPVGVILPPADTPTASFVITPTPVSTNVATNFDASASCPGSAAGTVCSPSNNTIDSYSWGFGDGGAAMGRATSHFYTVPGIYTVTLTVTNSGGKSASATQTVTVSVSAPPTGDWTFSAVPTVGVPVIFNATTILAAPGHPIGRWDWDFGDVADRTPGSGPVTTHTFLFPNTYEVILSVTDDRGLTTVFPQSLTVK